MRFVFLAGLLFLGSSAMGATVFLKDGSVLQGTILKGNVDGLEIQTQDGVLRIQTSRIERVDYVKNMPAGVPPPPPPDFEPRLWEQNLMLLGLGGSIPSSYHQFNQIAGSGAAFSLEYLRSLNDIVSLGLGLNGMSFNQKTVNTVMFNSQVTASASTLMLLSHIKFFDDETVFPYGAIGVGINSYSEKAATTPNPGFVWADTGTTETRTGTASSNGLAAQAGIGLQTNFSRHFVGALESDWNFLTVDQNKFGASSLEVFTVEAKIGWRY